MREEGDYDRARADYDRHIRKIVEDVYKNLNKKSYNYLEREEVEQEAELAFYVWWGAHQAGEIVRHKVYEEDRGISFDGTAPFPPRPGFFYFKVFNLCRKLGMRKSIGTAPHDQVMGCRESAQPAPDQIDYEPKHAIEVLLSLDGVPEVFELWFCGVSMKEIALGSGRSLEWVRLQMKKALDAIEEALGLTKADVEEYRKRWATGERQ